MTVGIVGAGQLGRMLALAGYPLGQDFLFLDRTTDTRAQRSRLRCAANSPTASCCASSRAAAR
jgi:phosphoribosylaminoimidazole carboxylase (NCAIR synthetase)